MAQTREFCKFRDAREKFAALLMTTQWRNVVWDRRDTDRHMQGHNKYRASQASRW